MENNIQNDLRLAIQDAGGEQQRFARAIGVSDAAVSYAVSGAKPVSEAICKALGYQRRRVVSYLYERISAPADETPPLVAFLAEHSRDAPSVGEADAGRGIA